MARATIDNDPISITLSSGESTTVPNGEVWEVTISIGVSGQAYDYRYQFHSTVNINNTPALSYITKESINGFASPSIETTVSGGDTISFNHDKEENSKGGVHIGGYRVA